MKYVGAYITDQPTLATVPQAAHAMGCTAIGIVTAPTNVWHYSDPDESLWPQEIKTIYGYSVETSDAG